MEISPKQVTYSRETNIGNAKVVLTLKALTVRFPEVYDLPHLSPYAYMGQLVYLSMVAVNFTTSLDFYLL